MHNFNLPKMSKMSSVGNVNSLHLQCKADFRASWLLWCAFRSNRAGDSAIEGNGLAELSVSDGDVQRDFRGNPLGFSGELQLPVILN
jgi:hypothetical protein